MTSLGTPPGSDSASDPQTRRRRSARVLLPAGVAAVAALGVGLVPALAASTSPQLPKLTAQQLIAKVLSAHEPTVSGTVQSTVDLGVPSQLLGALPTSGASAAGTAGIGGSGAANADASAIDPQALAESLLSGTHTFQVASDGPLKQRFSAPDISGGPYSYVRDGSSAWIYHGASHTATHITGLPTTAPAEKTPNTTPQAAAQRILSNLGPTTNVSVEGATRVAGQNAYVLLLSPKGSGSTIGDVRIAVDSAHYVPLQLQVQPSDGSGDLVNILFTKVSFTTPHSGDFAFVVPNGSKIVTESAQQLHAQRPSAGQDKTHAKGQGKVIGQGWQSVYEITPNGIQGTGKNAGKGLGELKSFGKSVPGGTLFSTRALNVLVTDQGTVYAGLVTPQVLEQDAR